MISDARRQRVALKYFLMWRRDDHLVPRHLAHLRKELRKEIWASCRSEKARLLVQARDVKSYFQFDVRKKADDLNVIPC